MSLPLRSLPWSAHQQQIHVVVTDSYHLRSGPSIICLHIDFQSVFSLPTAGIWVSSLAGCSWSPRICFATNQEELELPGHLLSLVQPLTVRRVLEFKHFSSSVSDLESYSLKCLQGSPVDGATVPSWGLCFKSLTCLVSLPSLSHSSIPHSIARGSWEYFVK